MNKNSHKNLTKKHTKIKIPPNNETEFYNSQTNAWHDWMKWGNLIYMKKTRSQKEYIKIHINYKKKINVPVRKWTKKKNTKRNWYPIIFHFYRSF